MKLYHVTNVLDHCGFFYPRIPVARTLYEDEQTDRVCFSSSIEGCLNAMPNGGENLEEMLGWTNGVLKVFEVDTDNFSKEDILDTDTILERKLVTDADMTGEYWLLRAFFATRSYLIQIQSFKTKQVEHTVMWRGKPTPFYQTLIERINYVSINDEVLNLKFPYPGEDELETFIDIGSKLIGKPLKRNKTDMYSTAQNKEEFLRFVASFGELGEFSFGSAFGSIVFEDGFDMEKHKMWYEHVLYGRIEE